MKKMAKSAAFLILALFVSCAVQYNAEAADKKANENIQSYTADLGGDGSKNIIEVEDKSATERAFVLTISKKNKKQIEKIESISIFGKIRKLELVDLSNDGKKQIVLYFNGADNLFNIAVYQMENNQLGNIFSAKSPHVISGNFVGIPQIKIRNEAEISTWYWNGEKFVKG